MSREDFALPPEDREDPVEVDEPAYVPLIYRWTSISHYYGDTVRFLLLLAAATMLVFAPFYTDDLTTELPFIVVAIFVLVAVAALTTPAKKTMISADAVVSGVGLVIFEMWALFGYSESTIVQFVLREILALIFLFAFYYSTKTLRAMFLRQVGIQEKSISQQRDSAEMSDKELRSLRGEEMRAHNLEVTREYDD